MCSDNRYKGVNERKSGAYSEWSDAFIASTRKFIKCQTILCISFACSHFHTSSMQCVYEIDHFVTTNGATKAQQNAIHSLLSSIHFPKTRMRSQLQTQWLATIHSWYALNLFISTNYVVYSKNAENVMQMLCVCVPTTEHTLNANG